MDTPAFIFGLIDEELKRIKIDLLKNVATKYNLELSELISEFIEDKKEKIVPPKEVKITVKKTLTPRKPVEKDLRCMARIWNRGKGGQCSKYRSVMNNKLCEFCTNHLYYQKHGRIDEAVPRDLFPFKASALYK